MTTPRIYEATPSAIASRLLTSEATAEDRVLVEAMVERALRMVEAKSPLGAILLVERKVISAMRDVGRQEGVRMARFAKLLEDLQTVGDDTDEDAP